MGQSQSNKNKISNQWNLVDTLGKFQIYRNQNNQLAQKHIVKVDPKIDQSDYLTAYYQRYLPNKPIVNAYDASFSQKSKSMCQNSSTITVFTQYIPYRLSEIKKLNHGQGMYVLSEALSGFAQLYGRVGPFQINQNLIGFNQQGEVKVWYNPNFADNSIDNDRIILMSTVNPYDFDRKFSQNQQHDMVQDIFNSVARYTRFHPMFLQQAQQIKKLGFSDARRIISNQIGRKAYYVPDHLFLNDRNGIIKKSGIELKNKHVYNPNKPKRGQSYPYFMQAPKQQGQVHYLQGQIPPNYYNYYNDDSSQSDSYGGYDTGQGYYNMNGQNYRIVATRQIEGDHVNQQQIINEVLRNQNQNISTHQNINHDLDKYKNNPNYQIVYANNNQNIQNPQQHRFGHIVVNDGSNKKSKTRVIYAGQNQTYQPQTSTNQQQNVRIFSIGQDGRLIQQNHHNRHDTQSTQHIYNASRGNSHAHSEVRKVQPKSGVYINPNYQASNFYHQNPQYHSVVSQVHGQGIREAHYVPAPIQQVRQYETINRNPNIDPHLVTHRHRIFEPQQQAHQSLIREGPIVVQRGF